MAEQKVDQPPMSEFHRLQYRLASALAAMVVAAQPAVAEPVQLNDADLRQLVPGVTIELDTPVGVRLPVTYTADGLMTGEAGRLEAYLGTPRDRGRWWIADGKLCQKWFRWLDAKPRCAIIMRSADRILWRDDSGEKGTATITSEARSEPEEPTPSERKPTFATMTPQLPVQPPVARQPSARSDATTSMARTASPAPAEISSPTTAETPVAGTDRFAAPALAAAVQRPSTAATSSPAKVAAASPTARGTARVVEPAARRVGQAPAFNPPIPLPTRRLAEQPEAPPSPFARAIAATGGTFRVRGVMSNDILNVRQGPSEAHPVVGGLQPGAGSIRIVGRCVEAWCEVTAPRANGWVNVIFLAPERILPRRRFDPFSSLGGPSQ